MISPPSRPVIAVPWDAPGLRLYNGRHPLPESLLAETPDFRFDPTLAVPTEAATESLRADVGALHRELIGLPHVDDAAAANFIASRDLASQRQMSTPADLLFLHTCPMTLGQRPWAIHIEITLPLFEPYFGHFRTWDIDLDAQPAYHMVRHLLRHPNCRAIFTHIARTRDDLPVLFNDPALADKVHYGRLGLPLDAATRGLAAAAHARKNAKAASDEFVILFTNSWHQVGDSFYKRGGMEALMSFVMLLEEVPNSRLILRSPLPEQFNDGFRTFVRGHPRIELHEAPVSDADLFGLLARADAFVLPSANLHTISMLRAMALGAVVVVSDAVAVDEFVTDGATGIVVSGRRNVSYREDRARGLLRERIDPVKEVDALLTAQVAGALKNLATDMGLRRRLRENARRHVETAHAAEPWRAAFHAMLHRALAGKP